VADLKGTQNAPGRNVLAGHVVSNIVQFLAHFEEQGFAPFVDAFDARHRFHMQQVSIVRNEVAVVGRVAGISNQGALLLQTEAGIQEFHSGEVSMRQSL
jgi:BirA family transcriptional regulator, biotin operon repressor / biotin---[acetyl-CoA-carboxylase] ligase